MSRFINYIYRRTRWLLAKQTWFSFSLCLLIGFVVSVLLGHSFQRVSAVPAIVMDRFESDVNPTIDVLHNPPVITHSSEKIKLEFHFVCKYVDPDGSCCNPSGTLFVSYGDGNDFKPKLLVEEDHDSLRVLTSTLPVVDESGRSLRRYYLQVTHPQVGLEVRYPTAGAVDLFVASDLIPVDLPVEKPIETGEIALGLPWGDGAEEVGLMQIREGYP